MARSEATVDQRQVGIAGVEAAARQRCGEPPDQGPSDVIAIVGVHPHRLVHSWAWRARFEKITKDRFKDFADRLAVSSKTELMSQWVVGSGIAPHSGGSEEAALAINTQTGEVFAAMLEEGQKLSGFGFGDSWEAAPPYLQQWAKARR